MIQNHYLDSFSRFLSLNISTYYSVTVPIQGVGQGTKFSPTAVIPFSKRMYLGKGVLLIADKVDIKKNTTFPFVSLFVNRP
jgi:hypothetical protein